MIQSIINEQARVLIDDGVARKAMRRVGLSGDCLPVALCSQHPETGVNHYFIGLKLPDRTKLVPIGQINEAALNASPEPLSPFTVEEVLVVAGSVANMRSASEQLGVAYNLETGLVA